jgi:peptidoglycan/LPS O-acetylase OafA/YrhL
VVVIALPLTFLLDTIGMVLNPSFYSIQKVLWKPESWAGYFSSFFFVNEYQILGFNGISPGSNGPYWSLSFEATYYLLAGIVLFSRRAFWIPASIIVLFLAGKTITALLPIWMLGFLLFRIRIPDLKSIFLQVAFWGSALLLLFSPIIESHLPKSDGLIYLPWGRGPFNRDLVGDYFIAFTFAVHLISARALLSSGFRPLDRLQSTIRWLGSLTFPLYLFHYPVLCLFVAISPWGDTSVERVVFVSALTALIVIALTPVCGKLKKDIRKKFMFANFIHPRILGLFSLYAKKRFPVGE